MTHAEELIELLDKETISEDAMHGGHPSSPIMQEQLSAIEETFRAFGLRGNVFHAYCAPQANCFGFSIPPRERTSAYCDIKDSIQKNVGGNEVRMVVPVSGQNYGRIEIANSHRAVVAAGEMFRSTEWQESRTTLPLMLGKGIDGRIEITDLAKAPHLLVTGCTGSGKSVFLHSCIHSLMFRYKSSELKLILADSRMDEFGKYRNLPYLQFPVINSTQDTLRALQWLDGETDTRYRCLRDFGFKDIKSLNERIPGSLPYIVIIIDEISDFMIEAKTQIEPLLEHLCGMGRAVGIHLIISTQRDDSRVLTPSIKACFPVRIAFRLADSTSSQIILNSDDAASLAGRGDMLFKWSGAEGAKRIQGVYVNDKESARIIEHLTSIHDDMKPSALPPMLGTLRKPNDALHDKLFDIARDVFKENMGYLIDDAIDDACNEIADSIIEHWDELKEVDEGEQPTEDDSDLTGSDFESSLSEEDCKMLLKAIRIVVEDKRPMISYIQRRLAIGYNKAFALLETMERFGIVSSQPEHGYRSVLVDTYEEAISRLPKQI